MDFKELAKKLSGEFVPQTFDKVSKEEKKKSKPKSSKKKEEERKEGPIPSTIKMDIYYGNGDKSIQQKTGFSSLMVARKYAATMFDNYDEISLVNIFWDKINFYMDANRKVITGEYITSETSTMTRLEREGDKIKENNKEQRLEDARVHNLTYFETNDKGEQIEKIVRNLNTIQSGIGQRKKEGKYKEAPLTFESKAKNDTCHGPWEY